MSDKQNGWEQITKVFDEYSLIVVVITFGAIAHVMVKIKEAREKNEKFTKVDMVLSLIIALFSGMVFTLISMGLGATGVALGLSGSMGSFLGLTVLNKYGDQFLSRVGGNDGKP